MAHRFSAPLFFPLIAAIVLGAALGDAGAQSPSQLDTPLDAPGGPPGLIAVQPMWNPAPLLVQGKAYLVYELLLTNFQTAPITLDSLRADGGPMGVFKFDDGDLKSMLDVPARYGPPGQELNVNPLQTRMLLLWLPFESTRVPHRILHKINYSVASGTGAQVQRTAMSVVADPMPVDYRATPVSIGPPLRGGNWLAANGPSNTSPHRRAFMVANGEIYFPERFAIDFVQLGPDGKTYKGDPRDNGSYHAYGADLLAVADGTVVDARSGIKDNVPGATVNPLTMATIAGNYIIEDIGGGAYAFYAHIKPGSIKVYVGEHVKRGQLLASLGNTGNSSEPHLHFHVIDRPSPLAGRGIPYAFDRFSLVPGHIKSGDQLDFAFESGHPVPVQNSLVLENAVIDFP